MFDANGNGKLSADEINLDFVSAEILEIFKPLLVELETFNEELDKDEFVESALALLETLDIQSRNTVLNFGRKVPKSHVIFETNKFHPQISKRSHYLAERKKAETCNLPPEQRFQIQQEIVNNKLQQLKRKIYEDERQKCPFTPQIIGLPPQWYQITGRTHVNEENYQPAAQSQSALDHYLEELATKAESPRQPSQAPARPPEKELPFTASLKHEGAAKPPSKQPSRPRSQLLSSRANESRPLSSRQGRSGQPQAPMAHK